MESTRTWVQFCKPQRKISSCWYDQINSHWRCLTVNGQQFQTPWRMTSCKKWMMGLVILGQAVNVLHDSNVSMWAVVCLGPQCWSLVKDSGPCVAVQFKRGPSGNHWKRLKPCSHKSFYPASPALTRRTSLLRLSICLSACLSMAFFSLPFGLDGQTDLHEEMLVWGLQTWKVTHAYAWTAH